MTFFARSHLCRNSPLTRVNLYLLCVIPVPRPLATVHRTCRPHEYEVMKMTPTSSITAAGLFYDPPFLSWTVTINFHTRRYLSSSKMMKCLCLSSKIIRAFGDFFNANICTAGMRFLLRLVSKLFSTKFGFSPFFRLYGLLDGFLSQIWSCSVSCP